MPGDFDLVKERVDIVQLVGESVPLKKAGRGYVGLCPFHNEKSPSFHVDPERRTYKCFGCLPPGSLIKTGSGPRPIESIQRGEKVYARDGRLHPVVELHEHWFAGDLIQITCAPFKIPVLLTPDHKVPVMRPRSRRVEEVPAGLIRPQNYLLYPPVERTIKPLDWAALPIWFGKRGKRPKALPTAVDVVLFAEWLGWYLAEGSVSNDRSVRFSLGGDEIGPAERIVDLSQLLFGETPRMDRDESRIEMWFCHALLSRWLKHNCGDGARNKRLPDFVWGWAQEAQQSLLDALVLGDGKEDPGGYVQRFGYHAKPSWALSLASVTLIDDVRDLLLHMGVVPGLSERTEANGHRSWQVAVSAGGQQRWGAGERLPSEPLPVRVRRVERVAYEGSVYNLTVDQDHTYLTMSGAVCNCGEGGDVFTWLEKREGLTKAEALNTLAERAGVELTRRAPDERKFEDRLLQANDTAAFYFRQALRGTPRGKEMAAYLAKRGITPESIDSFGIGYAPNDDSLMAYLKKKAFSDEEAVAAGLVTRNERGLWSRFRDRLIVPIRDRRGRAVAFGGRAMRPDQLGKYINSNQTLLFNKSATLYGLDKAAAAIRKEGVAVIVEGYFDTIACHQSGFTNVVASMGTALTEDQYRVLNDMKIERAIVAFDGDAAGQRSAESRGRELLSALSRFGAGAGGGQLGTRTGLALFVTVLPEGLDPDDVARKEPDLFRRLLADAKPLLEFLIDRVRETSRLDQPEGQLRFLQRTAALIAEEPDPVRREVYLSDVAGSAGVDPAFLRGKLPAAGKSTQRTTRRPTDPPAPVGGASSTTKQMTSRERYVMALLTRYPEEIARADLAPTDLVDPLLRDLFEQLQAGKRPDSDLPAQLAALAAALGANAPELDEQTDPGQVIEIAALRLRVDNVQRRLGEARVQLAHADGDVGGLDSEIARMGEELERLMKRRERRTVLHSELEREEDR